MKYYLVGIKGTGCSSLACFLKDMGHLVHGSDVKEYYFTEEKLIEKGISYYEYNVDNIDGKDIYIIGLGNKDNIETKKIIKNDYMYYYYNDFIDSIKYKTKIAVSGTHGKTTTCKILAKLLNDISPSYIIGDGSGFGNIHSKELIFEACEYKEHFLAYHPEYMIINNIELDHPDFYKNKKQLIKSFQKAANQSENLIINGDDHFCKKIKHSNIITFGFNEENDYRCKILGISEKGYIIKINEEIINLPFFGKHMIYNFLAAYTLVNKFYKNEIKVININDFKLPNRRLNIKEKFNHIFIDDYAHHPTEINALFDAVKQKYPGLELIAVFQPHTYSRTLKYKKDFVKVLGLFDKVYIYPTFTSREKYSIKNENKVKSIFRKYINFSKIEIFKMINSKEKKVFIFIGAGNINEVLNKLLKEYETS